VPEEVAVDTQDQRNAHPFNRLGAYDSLDGVAVAGELLLVAVTETDRLAGVDQLSDTVGSDDDPSMALEALIDSTRVWLASERSNSGT
jgi:hypothetical protein